MIKLWLHNGGLISPLFIDQLKVASFRILFFLIVLSGIIAINAFLFPVSEENASASQFSYELFISQADQDKNLDKFVGEDIRSFSRIPGNSFNAYKPYQNFLLKLKFNHPLGDDLALHIRQSQLQSGLKFIQKTLFFWIPSQILQQECN